MLSLFLLSSLINAHVFVGNPPPFRWDLEIDKLIMPLNGDPNHEGPEWGQQPFPCKGYHRDGHDMRPQVTWYSGQEATFQ